MKEKCMHRMNRHFTPDNTSDLETSPSDIIEIEESPVKSKKKKKKKSFSFDSKDSASTSSSPKHSKQGKLRQSTTGDKSNYNTIPNKTTGKVKKSLTNISGDRGKKRKTSSSSIREGQKRARTEDSDSSSDDEDTARRPSTGKRVRRGLAKRLYGNNSQASEVFPSGSGTDSQDGWYSTTKAPQPSTSQSTKDSHKPSSQTSSRQSKTRPASTASPYNSFIKLSSDSDVVKETAEPLHKKRITYHDSDPGSEGFDPSISDEAMGQLSSGNSSDDLFLTQTSAKKKSLPKKTVSSSESTTDSDVTIINSPVCMEAHKIDSDATTIESPVHEEITDTQLPDLTLKFMSSSSEEELDQNKTQIRRQKSDSLERTYHRGKRRVDQLAHHTNLQTNNNSEGLRTARNSGDSQESESLFGKPPSLSQHIQDDPYKFPSQSQDQTQSMPILDRMSNTNKRPIKGTEVKQELVSEPETTTDSDADIPLASLSVHKYQTKSTGCTSVKRERDNTVDDGNSDINLWSQSSKRFRHGSSSQTEGIESATQNYSLGQETIPNQSKGPDIKSEVDDKEILVPKIEPLSYGYTQDLDVVFIEDSDSDFEEMSQKIVEISSDEDDKLQDFDDADEFKEYFNLPDCDSDDNDLHMFGQRRDEDGTRSSAASNIDWVSVDSDDDFSYGLLTQPADGNSSIYDQPTQVDTADTESRVRFIEKVVTFEESDDEGDDPYEIATQVDEAEEERTVDEMGVYNTATQVDHVGITNSDNDMYKHCTQIDHPEDKHCKRHNRYSAHSKVAGQQDGEEPGEIDSVYSMDTQLDDVRSCGGSDGEIDSVYSADTQLDDDHRPEVYIDVDDKEEVCIKMEVMDNADSHSEYTEIDPYDLCVPVDRGQMSNVKPKHHHVRMAHPVEGSNMSVTNVNQWNSSSSGSTDKSNKTHPKTKSQGWNKKTNKSIESQSRSQKTKRGPSDLPSKDHATRSACDEEDNIYNAQTQVDVTDIFHFTDDEEDNIYNAQTQVDGTNIIHGTDDEEDNIYNAQTQVDGAGLIHGTDDEEEDIYSAQTQLDGAGIIHGRDDEEDNIYNAQTQVDMAGTIHGTDDEEDDIYNAQTQVDGAGLIHGTDDEEEDIYSAQTQVDVAGTIRGIDDEKDDIYTAQTQVDGAGFICDVGDEKDDIYTAQTQVDGAGFIGDVSDEEDDAYTAQTQIDGVSMFTGTDKGEEGVDARHAHPHRNEVKGHCTKLSKGEDINTDHTQVKELLSRKLKKVSFDGEKRRKQILRARLQILNKEAESRTQGLHLDEFPTEEDASTDKEHIEHPDLAVTQVDRGDPYLAATQMDVEDPYLAATQMDVEDPYLAATQIDGGVVLSSGSDDDKDLYMANTQIDNVTINSIEEDKNVSEKLAGDITISSTEEDNHMDVDPEEEGEEDTEPYSIDTQYDHPGESSLTLSDKYQKTEKSLVKSIDKIRFQNLIAVKKIVLPTEPQRLKTTAEKTESFRIQKSTFYSRKATESKKATDIPVQSSKCKKPTSSTGGWLSTATSVHSRTLPKMKGSKRQPKVQLDNLQQIKDKMLAARAQMSNRQQNSVKPTAHRNTSLTAPTGYDCDVKLPDHQEILAKQLPLLSVVVPTVKHTADSGPTLRDNTEITEKGRLVTKDKPPREKDKVKSGKKSSKHKDRKDRSSSENSSTESGSSKKNSYHKEKSRRPESGSSKHDSRNKERSPRPESGSSKSDKNKEKSPRPESGSSKHDRRNKERSPRPESRSSKHDSRNKESDSRNKERSPRPESRSSKSDKNKERSTSTESGSSKHDSRNKEKSHRPESGSSKHDSRNKERSPRPESGSSKNDKNKEKLHRPESGSSKSERRNKERSPRPESGSSKSDKNKERSTITESGSSKKDIQNKELSSNRYLGSSKKNDGNEEGSSVNTENNKRDEVIEKRSISLESRTSEKINFGENSMTGTKENLPPVGSVTISSTATFNVEPVSKLSKPSTIAHDPLPVSLKPRVGKMIRRPAIGPKSILSRPENRISKPGRRVVFELPEETTNQVPVISKLARSILAREERLPEIHYLRRSGRVTNPVGPLNKAKGAVPHVSGLNLARLMQKPPATVATVPRVPVPPVRSHNLMEKSSAPVMSQMNRALTDITGTNNTTPDRQYSLDNLLVKLLKWNPVWLKEQEKCPFPPPAIEEENPLFSLSESYSHFDDYIQLFTPHILMETWETTVAGYKKSVESGITKYRVHLSVVQSSTDKKFLHLTLNGVVTRQKYNSGECPFESDLVILNYMSEEPDPAQPNRPFHYVQRSTFGFTEKVTQHKDQDIHQLYNGLPQLREDAKALGSQNVVTLKLKLKIRNGRNLRIAPQPATIQRVVSLVSIVRQYNALVELRRNVLWRHILEPGRADVFAEVQPVTETLRTQLRDYNPSQQRAICTAAKVAMQPVNLPRICLLQGPPGTGKSHTIVGIVDKIIRDTQGRGRICLCTPSNAAVDEVIRRLITHKKRLTRDPNQLPYGLRVVRIGKVSSVHKDVAKHAFNEIVHGHIQNEIARKKEKNFPQSSQRELASLDEKISVLSDQLEHMEPADTNSVHRKRLQADLQKLEQKKADLKYQYRNITKSTSLTPAEEYEIKKNILWRAHVICGTLNSFGSGTIQNLLRSRHPSDQSTFIFNCIVMDEASQATELDCLIPLQYGTSKLIMVGDPEQLSPTVLSRKAEQKCFGQSMFERMYGYYKYKEHNPVILLDTQYRMNPEIAAFPSQYVYEGRLLSDRCVKERGDNFPLKPYLVFNIDEGHEQSSQAGSIKNEAEAHFVAMLCHKIIRHTDIPQTDIGIIAPYQSQKSLIVDYLRQWKMASIEVGTVDGFQGREKEVIIMSCVRASTSGGIGFVANRKRMNVALTRARSAMYVVGNLSSLERSGGDWKILIDDARNRSVILNCRGQTNFSSVIQTCFKRMPT